MRAYSPISLWLCCLVVCLLAAHQCSMAQGGGTRCWQVVSGSDEGCTADHDCISTDGCTAYPFTAACTGTYFIDAWTKCGEGKCYQCMSCVNIYEKGQYMANCHTTNCDHEICEYSCSNGVQLYAGQQYTMYVCLVACANSSCIDCGEDCIAYGCVRYNALLTCWQQ
jgi:hypothetical protein